MSTNSDGMILIIKILKNIIDDPNNEKYRNVNYNKLIIALKDSPGLIKLLYKAGFRKSDDNKILSFDITKLTLIHQIYHKLC